MAELYLIEFKGSRKEYFYNTYYHTLKPANYVIIQAERGEDIGLLSKKISVEVSFEETSKPRSILRRASEEDLSKYKNLLEKEILNKSEVMKLIRKHKLSMKVVDIEWQFDGNKMTVFFTADHRVDFRELVKDLASQYKTRIELRQIGVRDEARRLGGVGICGLQQCCNTFIRQFTPISTQYA
ncbi:MAG: stage 0 sporulation family protein, partial [Candidatus Zixiibacteriota bacterium]